MPTLRSPVLLIGLASLAILGSAFAFEHWGGLAPCELCWWQRYVYMLAAALAFLGFSLERAGAHFMVRWMMGVLAAVFLVGAGIAVFHVGVEQQWWRGLESCAANDLKGDIEMMLNKLMATPIARCDEVAWSLFGISMAGYNVLLSLGLAAVCVCFARPRKKASS